MIGATISDVISGRARWAVVEAEAFALLTSLEHDGAFVDALVTDPPYSSGGFTRGDRTASTRDKYQTSGTARYAPDFEGDNRDQRSFLAWATLWIAAAHALMRPSSPACVFTDWRQLPTMTDAFQAGGLVWRGVNVWSKGGNSRPQMGRYRSDAELVVWGTKGAAADRADVGCLPGTWTASPVPSKSRVHITEKPVGVVMENAVAICRPRGLVLDPFCGSGSTIIAAVKSGRRAIGIESNRAIARLARARIDRECRA